MAKLILNPVTGGYDLSIINNNFDKIETEFQNKVLYRDNPIGEPNTLVTDIDANSKRIYNLPEPLLSSEPARLQDLQNAVAGAAANLITATPYGHIVSTNVQTFLQELVDEKVSKAELVGVGASQGSDIVGYVTEDKTLTAALDERLPEIGTYALLRTYNGNYSSVYVRGRSNLFDGAQGIFRIVASVATDNDATLLVDALGRRWQREYSGHVSPKWFGAVGDGVADDKIPLQAFIDFVYAAAGYSEIVFGTGRFALSGQINIPRIADKQIIVDGAGATFIRHGAYKGVLMYVGEAIAGTSVKPPILRNLNFAGTFGVTDHSAFLHLENANGTVLVDPTFSSGTVGMFMDESYAVTIIRPVCAFQYSRGFSITSGSMNLKIQGGQFSSIGIGNPTGGAIVFNSAVHNISLLGIDLEGGNQAIVFTAGGNAITIDGCYVEGFSSVSPVYIGASSSGVRVNGNWIGFNAGTQTWDNVVSGVLSGNIFWDQAQTVATTCAAFEIGNNAFAGTSNFIGTKLTAPTLINGFSNQAGYRASAYTKDSSGMVHLFGTVAAAADNVAFTLPVGYRPSGTLAFATVADNGLLSRVNISAGGNVTVFRNSGTGGLSGISFFAEQ